MELINQESIQLILWGITVGIFAGMLAGTLAGLAGVGGGLIYVPVFYLAMPNDQQGMSAPIMTSMMAVALTGYFSARAHWRLGHLNRSAFQRLLPGLIIGAAVGLWSTLKIPEAVILLTMAVLDGWIAWDYGRKSIMRRDIPMRLLSAPIGYISGVLGVGGGTMLVPLLRRDLPLREAIGTSAACGMAMAIGAVGFNALFESGWRDQLSPSLPFVAGVLLGIALIIPRTSRWSAQLHALLPEAKMRQILKALFILLSASLFLAAALSS